LTGCFASVFGVAGLLGAGATGAEGAEAALSSPSYSQARSSFQASFFGAGLVSGIGLEGFDVFGVLDALEVPSGRGASRGAPNRSEAPVVAALSAFGGVEAAGGVGAAFGGVEGVGLAVESPYNQSQSSWLSGLFAGRCGIFRSLELSSATLKG
jgi:hypothetical protein